MSPSTLLLIVACGGSDTPPSATPSSPTDPAWPSTLGPAGTPIQQQPPSEETDQDQDGYASIASGGTDCDDQDASVNPGALEDACSGVDDDCDGVIAGGRVVLDDLDEYPCIALALADAQEGSTLVIGPGTYVERPVIETTVRLIAEEGPDTTILRGSVLATEDVSLELEGLTITGGTGTLGGAWTGYAAGGALHLVGPGSFRVTDAVLRDNQAEAGGAILVEAGDLILTGTTLEGNVQDASDVFLGGGAIYSDDRVELWDCTVRGNVADDGPDGIVAGELVVHDSVFEDHTGWVTSVGHLEMTDSTVRGVEGGLEFFSATITDSTLSDNPTFTLNPYDSLHLVRATLEDNRASDYFSVVFGSTVAQIVFEDSVFRRNTGPQCALVPDHVTLSEVGTNVYEDNVSDDGSDPICQ